VDTTATVTAEAEHVVAPRTPAFALSMSGLWLFLAVALPVLGSLLASLSTVDLAYHLRAGSLLLDQGAVPRTDTFTFTALGEPWLNQQWGAQGIFALVFRLGGWEGLQILRAVLIGLIFLLILRACRSRGAPPRTAALLTLAAFGVSVAALGLRPQLLAMVLFALCLVLVVERDRRPHGLWLIPIITIAWANVHGTFFLAPALLGVAWLEDLHAGRGMARRTFSVAVVAGLATLLNPFGVGLWGYALGLSTNEFVTSRISEWQPTSVRTVLGALFFASALGVAALLARRARPVPWPTLLWLGFLFLLGVYATRGVAWWPLGAAVVVAGLLGPSAAERAWALRPRRLNALLATILVLAGVVLLPYWRTPSPETGREGLLLHAPAALTVELRRIATADDRIFNPQPWGSWFELTVPTTPVFVDSRIELYAPSVWQDYAAVTEGRADWASVLERHGVTIVVTEGSASSLQDRLTADPGWRSTWSDETGDIFVRTP
jgi:hypothetical protein